MSSIRATSDVKAAQVEAVVIRADGSREDLGVVAYWHRNPLRRLMWRVQHSFRNPRRT